MLSMYERLMSLPLFKGSNQELIHAVVAKTHLLFTKVKPGEAVVSLDQPCHSVIALLSGSVVREHSVFDNNLVIRETLDAGVVLGVEYLFGLERSYGYTVKAREQCGLMQFSKEQYLNLLQDHPILMLNYLNYLAYGAQRCENALHEHSMSDIVSQLAFMVDLSTSRHARDIQIESTRMPVLEFMHNHCKVQNSEDNLQQLADSGIIRFCSEYVLEILSRRKLMQCSRPDETMFF